MRHEFFDRLQRRIEATKAIRFQATVRLTRRHKLSAYVTAIHGSCLCGGVEFEIAGPLTAPLNCHCSQCRKQHGAAFRSRVRVQAKDFRWLHGEHLVKFYESSRGYQRGFCSECGSPIINRNGPNFLEAAGGISPKPSPQYGVALALLDDPPLRPELHCFVASKAPWYEITDDLPQYPDYPPV